MKKYRYLFKNIALFTLINFSTKIIGLIFIPLYTQHLTTDEYALIDLFNVSLSLVLPVLTCCIYEAVLRWVIEKENEDNSSKIFSIGFFVITLGNLLLLLFMPLLQNISFLAYSPIAFILAYVSLSYSSLFSAFLRAKDYIKETVIISCISTIFTFALNVLFITVFEMGLKGYFLALIISNFVLLLLYIIVGKIHRHIVFAINDFALIKKMFSYSLPLIPNAFFWWVNSSVNRFFLLSVSLQVVGLYSVANKIPTLLNTFTSIFQQAWNLSAFKEHDKEDGTAFFLRTYEVYNLFMLLAAAGLIIISKYIAKFIFLNDFFEAWIFVPLLVFGFYFNSLNTFLGSIYTSRKETKGLILTTALGGIVNVLLNFLLVPRLGAQGSAIATAISYILVWIMRSFVGHNLLQWSPNYLQMIVSQLILLAISIIAIMDSEHSLIINITLFVLIVLIYFNKIKRLFQDLKNGLTSMKKT